MYNLIVSGHDGAWDEPHFTIAAGRYLEHTDEVLRERLKPLTPAVIAELTRLPTVFAYEIGIQQPVQIGRIKTIRERQGEIRITFEFEKYQPHLSSQELNKFVWEFDINKLEMGRTHWAVKDVDLFGALKEAGLEVKTPTDSGTPYYFSRKTIIAATSLLKRLSHADFDRMLLEFGVIGLSADRTVGGLQARANAVAEFAINNPTSKTAEQEMLSFALAKRAAEIAQRNTEGEDEMTFISALERDGLSMNEALFPTLKTQNDPLQTNIARASEAPIPGPSASMLHDVHVTDLETRFLIQPTVFKIPNGLVDKTLVAIMMPFEKSFDVVFHAIKGSCENAGLKCQRVDGLWEDSVVMQDVFSLIYKSGIVVVDFSTRNPNVFYETGIAHTLGKPVVPLAQTEQDVPFDLRHHRFLRYLNNGEGLKTLSEKLTDRLRTLSRG